MKMVQNINDMLAVVVNFFLMISQNINMATNAIMHCGMASDTVATCLPCHLKLRSLFTDRWPASLALN